jgi:hypothetical protein
MRNGGWKGAIFGVPVVSLIDEVDLARRGMIHRRVAVYVLEPHNPKGGPHVGIQVSHWTIGSWGTWALPLTREEARRLAAGLARAAQDSEFRNHLVLG